MVNGLLIPDRPAPARVRALMTTRAVEVVRLDLPAAPSWLEQVHGTAVVRAGAFAVPPKADASFTTQAGVVCVAKSADCLPVLFCDDAGSVVAAAHAGWRGLCAGVLEATVAALPARPAALMAWLGAAIGPDSFEVGPEVREAFVAADPQAAAAFRPGVPGKHFADLYALARQRLGRAGVTRIYGGGLDTLRDSARFYSYRRDGQTGRMAAMAWLAA